MRKGCLAVLVAALGTGALAVTPASGASTPQLNDARFIPGAQGGAPAIALTGTDTERPVSGGFVVFDGEGAAGSSACRPPGADGDVHGAQFQPNTPVTIAFPHQFSGTGTRLMLTRLDSNGCNGGGGQLFTSFAVTPKGGSGTPLLQPDKQVAVPFGGTLDASLLGPAAGLLAGLPPIQPPAANRNSTTPTGIQTPAIPSIPTVGPITFDPIAPIEVPQLPPLVPTLPGLPEDPYGEGTEVLAVAAAKKSGTCKDARLKPSKRTTARAARAALCLVNAIRRSRGLKALKLDRKMSRAAVTHSRDMIRKGYFAHVSPSGGTLNQRLRKARWLPRKGKWITGENIAAGSFTAATPAETVQGWWLSTAHRANMLDKGYDVAGMGVVVGMPGMKGSQAATYTNDFGDVGR